MTGRLRDGSTIKLALLISAVVIKAKVDCDTDSSERLDLDLGNVPLPRTTKLEVANMTIAMCPPRNYFFFEIFHPSFFYPTEALWIPPGGRRVELNRLVHLEDWDVM